MDLSQNTKTTVTKYISYFLKSEASRCDEFFPFHHLTISGGVLEFQNEEVFLNGATDQLQDTLENIQSPHESIGKVLFSEGIDKLQLDSILRFGKTVLSKLSNEVITNDLFRQINESFEEHLNLMFLRRENTALKLQLQCRIAKSEDTEYLTYWSRFKWLVYFILTLLLLISPDARKGKATGRYGVLTRWKTTKLLLWVCGDIELNPGPRNSKKKIEKCRSDILREFRKTQQTPILELLYPAFGDHISKPSLYATTPEGWPNGVPFFNLKNYKGYGERDCELCFDQCIKMLNHSVSDLSDDWPNILDYYYDLLHNYGHSEYLNLCKDKLLDWIGNKKIQKALQTEDTKSFMDDLRLKLKVLEDLAAQGEAIPDDIAEKVYALNLSINRSKRKRKEEFVKCDTPRPSKRQKSVTYEDMPTAEQISRSASDTVLAQSKTFDAEQDLTFGHSAYPNDLSLSAGPSGINVNSTFVPIQQTLDSGGPENSPTKNAAIPSLELPSEFLMKTMNENAENDILDNFDLDLLELSKEDLSTCFEI